MNKIDRKNKIFDLLMILTTQYNLEKNELIEIIINNMNLIWSDQFPEYEISVEYKNDDFYTYFTNENNNKELLTMRFSRAQLVQLNRKIESDISRITKENEIKTFTPLIGELFQCVIKNVQLNHVLLYPVNYKQINNLAVMPNNLYPSTERFVVGDKIYAILKDINPVGKHRLIFERNSIHFITKVLEQNIPELNNLFYISNVVRSPGYNTKVLLMGSEREKSPYNIIGACIGPNAYKLNHHIRPILNNERIDFLYEYDQEEETVKNAFRKNIVKNVYWTQEGYEIIVDNNYIGDALGPKGKNVSLIKRLLNLSLILYKEDDYITHQETKRLELRNLLIGIFNANEDDAEQASYNIENYNGSSEEILKYKEQYLKKNKDQFIELGGEEKLFKLHPSVPVKYYFKLLYYKIYTIKELRSYSNALNLTSATNIPENYTILLLNN